MIDRLRPTMLLAVAGLVLVAIVGLLLDAKEVSALSAGGIVGALGKLAEKD